MYLAFDSEDDVDDVRKMLRDHLENNYFDYWDVLCVSNLCIAALGVYGLENRILAMLLFQKLIRHVRDKHTCWKKIYNRLFGAEPEDVIEGLILPFPTYDELCSMYEFIKAFPAEQYTPREIKKKINDEYLLTSIWEGYPYNMYVQSISEDAFLSEDEAEYF